MCGTCVGAEVDITAPIEPEGEINQCRGCGRYLTVTGSWQAAEPESFDLLSLCLKRVRGLRKLKMVDAKFIWTEPHSRRLRLRITVEGEALSRATVRQSCDVVLRVTSQMCNECSRASRNQTWRAVVQVRQRVSHKRTMIWLEQLIIRRGAHARAINIEPKPGGIDLFFAARSEALHLIDFLRATVPFRYKASKKLVSHKIHTNEHNYQHTYSVELVPICKFDLCAIPPKVKHVYGGVGPLVLCYRVSQSLHMVDPSTGRTFDVSADKYFRHPFVAVASSDQAKDFVVLDIQPCLEQERPRGGGLGTLGPVAGQASDAVSVRKPAGKKRGGKGRRRKGARQVEEDLVTSQLMAQARARGDSTALQEAQLAAVSTDPADPSHAAAPAEGEGEDVETRTAASKATSVIKGVTAFPVAEAEVARASDLGSNDRRYLIRTHLSGTMEAGDTVQGYLLATAIQAAAHLEHTEAVAAGGGRDAGEADGASQVPAGLPDVVLLRKRVDKTEKRRKRRYRLRAAAQADRRQREADEALEHELEARGEEGEAGAAGSGGEQAPPPPPPMPAPPAAMAYDASEVAAFMRELQLDPELQEQLQLDSETVSTVN